MTDRTPDYTERWLLDRAMIEGYAIAAHDNAVALTCQRLGWFGAPISLNRIDAAWPITAWPITDAGRAASAYPDHCQVWRSRPNTPPLNFEVVKHHDEVHVSVLYPPRSNAENQLPHADAARCRYVVVQQESVRASDGVRLHYDYARDGFVVEQPHERLVKTSDNTYESETDWVEVGFFRSWAFAEDQDVLLARADAEYEARSR